MILLRKLLSVWDPDFVKVTPKEKKLLDRVDKEIQNSEYLTDDEIRDEN